MRCASGILSQLAETWVLNIDEKLLVEFDAAAGEIRIVDLDSKHDSIHDLTEMMVVGKSAYLSTKKRIQA